MMTADTTLAPCPTEQWKCGNELLPYHPSASHVDPAYRDGWNACYAAFRGQAPAPQGPALVPLTDAHIKEVMDLVSEWGMASHLSGEAQLEAHSPEATSDEITYAEERTDAERSAWQAIESKLRAHGITGAPNGKPT